jgi:hypothetical protein
MEFTLDDEEDAPKSTDGLQFTLDEPAPTPRPASPPKTALGAASRIVSPLLSAGEKVLTVLDTPGRVTREGITSAIEGRDMRVKDAIFNDNQAGDAEQFLDATNRSDSKVAQLFNTAGKTVGRQLIAGPIPLGGQMLEGAEAIAPDTMNPIMKGAVDTGKLMLADPSNLFTGGGAGAVSAGKQFARAAKRGGITLGDDAIKGVQRMFELGDFDGIKRAFTSLGGKAEDLAHVAGQNLESLGNDRWRVGVPFAQDKLGFEPGRVISKLTGLPEDLTGRAMEKGSRLLAKHAGIGYDLPKHAREAAYAERASAVNNAKLNTDEALNELQALQKGTTKESRTAAVEGLQQPLFSQADPAQQKFAQGLDAFATKHNIELPAGDPLDAIPNMLRAGKKKEAVDAYRSWVGTNIPDAPPEVLNGAAQAFETLGNSKLLKAYDSALRVFKEIRLYGNPAWMTLNAVEDAHKMMVFGIKDPKAFARAAKFDSLPAGMPVISSPSGNVITKSTMEKIFRDAGAMEGNAGAKFGMDEHLGRIGQGIADIGSLGVNRAVKWADNKRETLMKRAFLIDQLERGIPVRQAANNMRKVLFDVNIRPPSSLAGVQDVMKRVFPFIGYSIRSARAVPELIAKNPGAALAPVRMMQAMQYQTDPNTIPRDYARKSGAYSALPDAYEGVVDQGMQALGADPLADNASLTMQGRGTLLEPWGAVQDVAELKGGLTPALQLPIQAAWEIGPFGDHTEKPITAGQVAGTMISTPVQRIMNAIGRRVGGMDESLVGLPTEYKKPAEVEQKELLGIPNTFSPIPLKLTTGRDHKQDVKFHKKDQKAERKRERKKARKAAAKE